MCQIRARVLLSPKNLSSDSNYITISIPPRNSCEPSSAQVPPRFQLAKGPIHLQGNVVTGFGRGSKQLGVPTANIPPQELQSQLADMPKGVYFGWAQVQPAAASPAADSQVHKMVMNVGSRPTVNTGDEDLTVELHILHQYESDFYGLPLKAVVLGYIRPEMKFNGLPQLLNRIKADIGIARVQLDDPSFQKYKEDVSFERL